MLKEFNMGLVKVTDPYYVNALDKVTEYLLRLDPDRLLAGFKAVAEGKDPQKESDINLYGGWEGGWSLLRGHTMGHYLTAMSQAYKQGSNNDPDLKKRIKEKIDYTVSQLKVFQDASLNGFIFASPETHFDVIEGKCTGHHWVPWYTMHKIVIGLVHAYNYTGNSVALEVASKLGDWCYERTSKWDAELHRRVLNIEYGAINDALYELYKVTKDEKHLEAAKMFDEDEMFTQVNNGNNIFENRHANTQIPKFVGALNRYRVLGEEASFYFNAAKEFWDMVIKDHTYVTGGNSECEHFRAPGKLDATRTNLNNETCNAYNMLLLTRELFKITGDVQYANFYENCLINEIMASINPETGMVTYFKPMATGFFKAFGTETESFWCCTGTGMENFTKLGDSIYFYNENDLYVNLYISSKVNWDNKGLVLTQEANIPLDEQVKFKIESAPSNSLTIKFRIPSWLATNKKASITINGEMQPATIYNGYLCVEKEWVSGDTIELNLPVELQVNRLVDNKDAVAFTYGPVVLCATHGTEKMIVVNHWASVKPTMPEEVKVKDYIIIDGSSVDDWVSNIEQNMVKTPGKFEFTLRNTDEDENLKFIPYYLEYKERYGIYYRLVEQDSPVLQKYIKEDKEINKRLDATIDTVQVTNDQFELVHNLQGNSAGGFLNGHNYRHVRINEDGNGWFSYDFAVNPQVENYLSTRYFTGDVDRKINIYVDDNLLVEETITEKAEGSFYDVLYSIPSEWLAGKSKITVKFANSGADQVGRVFDYVSILQDFDTNAELANVIINEHEVELIEDTYIVNVPKNTDEVTAQFTPVSKYAVVSLDEIVIDDTQKRVIPLLEDTTILKVKVIAPDDVNEHVYTVKITRT